MTQLQKEDKFLSGISREELKEFYKKEKKPKPKLRLLAAILRKEGKTFDDIASSIQKPKTTIHDWLHRFEDGTLKQLYDKKQSGKPSKLSKKQKEELKKVLENSPQKQGIPFVLWTTKLVQYIIIKLFDVKYELWNIRKTIKKINFSLQTPRQEHRKANKKAQEEFKKNLSQKYNITLNLDLRSSVLMKRIS